MRGAFLDRDGVINVDYGYVYKIDKFEFKEGIFELLKLLQNMGFLLFVVTNQSGIARGYFSEDDFKKVTKYMLDGLKEKGIVIKEVVHCPCHPDFNNVCECRKPSPKMILDLAKKYNINLEKSLMIGDKESDMQAAKRAGIKKSYLVNEELFDIIRAIKEDFKGS